MPAPGALPSVTYEVSSRGILWTKHFLHDSSARLAEAQTRRRFDGCRADTLCAVSKFQRRIPE